jgi:hypothetical protein
MAALGKGYYIWQIPDCEGGSVTTIQQKAQAAGLGHVLVKVADGQRSFNITSGGLDLAAQVVQAVKSVGIQAWGWQYIYGESPVSEARIAIQRIKELKLDGFVVNAEVEFKEACMGIAATKYMTQLRSALPNLPIALSSYRFPSYHPQFPFAEFLQYCDINMPQVYWVGAHNPDSQLAKCVNEFQGISPFRPIIPTGSAYASGSWQPNEADVNTFLRAAKQIGATGANFWSWDYCSRYFPNLWVEIGRFDWNSNNSTQDIVALYMQALNAQDAASVSELFNEDGVHITTEKSVQGKAEIKDWYKSFFSNTFPNGTYSMVGYSSSGYSRRLTWEATSASKTITDGRDTFGIRDGKIAYHYSYYDLN